MTRLALSPSDPAFFQNPYSAYADWHAGNRTFFWTDFGFWCLAGYDEAHAAFRDKRLGRSVPGASREDLGWEPIPDHTKPFWDFDEKTLLNSEPPDHTRLRSLVSRAFTRRGIERMGPLVAQLAHGLVDRFSGDEVDIIRDFATPIPVLVIAEMLGVPAEDTRPMLDWSHAMVAMYQFGRTRAIEDRAVAATHGFRDYVRKLIDARRRSPGEDLLSSLIAARDGGDKLSDEELENTIILTLIAGHEATVHALGNGIKTLLVEKVDVAAAFATPDLRERAVEECLRFDPPLHLFTRYALEDMELFGVPLKRGETIAMLLGAANRDPRRWSDPDRFDPARPVQTNLSFGGGIHFCVGAPLARLEMAVAIPTLFQRVPGLALAGVPRYRDSYHFHGLESLMVRLR
jgi:cytochrome P450